MKRFQILLPLLMLVLLLCACGQSPDVPDGMQVCRGGDDVGYEFYVPEEWTISNVGDISAAYVSRLNVTSVSLVPIAPENGQSLADYFAASCAEMPYAITLVTENDTDVVFGNADEKTAFLYTYVYKDSEFRALQVLARYHGQAYLFTYNSMDAEFADKGISYFDFYFEEAEKVMESIVFHDRTDDGAAKDYTKDEDGFSLISDKQICGFRFYAAPDFSPVIQSGIVSVSATDGSNITVSRVTETGYDMSEYFRIRITDLEKTVADVQILQEPRTCSFADAKNACDCEYTYSYGGETYHVYQVFAISGMYGYAFTYTAKEAAYNTHLDNVRLMMSKVSFQ